MTTASVAKTAADRIAQGDLKGIMGSIEDWVKRARANREAARIEEWNMAHLAMLESRGITSYK